MAETPRLEFRDVSFRYPQREREALKAVSFSLSAGELAVLGGASGAGKSTLALAVNGTIPKLLKGDYGGEVLVNGSPATEPRELAREVGVVFQEFEAHLVSSTVSLEAAFPLENIGLPQAEMGAMIREALDLVGLSGFEERVPAELSGGEKQRLAIAAAMVFNPALLVLDEPLTDLDPLGKAAVLEVVGRLKSRGTTVLMIEHDPAAFMAADRALVLSAGELVYDGGAGELLADPGRCRILGIPVWTPALVASECGLEGGLLKVEEIADALKGRVGGKPSAKPAAIPASASEPVIEVESLTSGYRGSGDVIKGVNLSIGAGDCVALLGQNGSGKTTLAKHMVGLVKARKGRVLVSGRPASSYRLGDLSRVVGYLFQNPDHQIFSETVREEVAFGVRNLSLPEAEVERRVAESLFAVGLSGREAEDPFSLTKGERQRLAVASLLAYRPQVIIFDEPTTGLDAGESHRMMEFIRKLNGEGMTVILITHAMWAAAEYARRVIVMSKGAVVMDGPTREIFAREKELKELYLSPPPAAEIANRLMIDAISADELISRLAERAS